MFVSLFFQHLANIIVTDRRDTKYSYFDLVRTPKMRRLALLTGFTWCVASFHM